MIPNEENQTVLGALITGAVVAVGFICAWIWNNTMGRIKKLEESKVDKATFDHYTKAAEQSRNELRDAAERNRQENRESIARLFEKIDEVKDMIRARA